MSYTTKTSVEGDFDDVVATTESALEEEGFGILSDIDMGGTLEEKLDVDFRRYRILGACNPPFAYDAVTEEIDIGALLPCNVIVYEGSDDEVVVAAADARALLDLTGNSALDDIAADIYERLDRALDTIPESV